MTDISNMARYFTRTYDFPSRSLTKYCVEDGRFYQVGLKSSGLTTHEMEPGETFEQAHERVYRGMTAVFGSLYETVLAPGQYYPRIARPLEHDHEDKSGKFPVRDLYTREIAGASGQLISIVGRLESICRVVEPTPTNLAAYGHEIRECLLIAAMEIEAQWKAILRANGTDGSGTKDYVKLLPAMRLDEYEITFLRYPALGPVRPFEGWNASQPTQSLPFYHAYNSVKHDRETEFSKGTLEQTFCSVAGCAVLSAAQFGWARVFTRNRDLLEFFGLSKVPVWDSSDLYWKEEREWPATAVPYPF